MNTTEKLEAENKRPRELTEDAKYLDMVVDDLVCYTKALRMERRALRTLIARMYRDIGRAYVRGRPLEPHQYDESITGLGIEVAGK